MPDVLRRIGSPCGLGWVGVLVGLGRIPRRGFDLGKLTQTVAPINHFLWVTPNILCLTS
jgi:hypothetical protein